MAPDREIPQNVLRFIGGNIDDVPQLETLLMLSADPGRDWLVGEVAARNYVTEQRAEAILNALQRRGLIASAGSPLRFRFAPATPDVRALVAEVATFYQGNLARIATLIHSKPAASITEFARAFDLKKDR